MSVFEKLNKNENSIGCIQQDVAKLRSKFEGYDKGAKGENFLKRILDASIPGLYEYHRSFVVNNKNVIPDFVVYFKGKEGKLGVVIDCKNYDASSKSFFSEIAKVRKDLKDKYSNLEGFAPFIVVFLTTEESYYKILNQEGYIEESFEKDNILFTGPTTIVALIGVISYISKISDFNVNFSDIALRNDIERVIVDLDKKLGNLYSTVYGCLTDINNCRVLMRTLTSNLDRMVK